MLAKKSYWYFELTLSLLLISFLALTGFNSKSKALMIVFCTMTLFVSLFITIHTVWGYLRGKVYISSFVLWISILIFHRYFIDDICYTPTEASQFFQVILPLLVSVTLALSVASFTLILFAKKETHEWKKMIKKWLFSFLLWLFLFFLLLNILFTLSGYAFYPQPAEDITVTIINETGNSKNNYKELTIYKEYLVSYFGESDIISIKTIYVKNEGINIGDQLKIRYYFGLWGGAYKVLY